MPLTRASSPNVPDYMKYAANPDVVSTSLDDNESVLLNLKTRRYYTINETGSVIWNELKAGRSTEEIVSALTREFDITEEAARTHVDSFLEELMADDIVRRS